MGGDGNKIEKDRCEPVWVSGMERGKGRLSGKNISWKVGAGDWVLHKTMLQGVGVAQ